MFLNGNMSTSRIVYFSIFFITFTLCFEKSVEKSSVNYYRPFFKNGRVLGGMVGHWKEDFSGGLSERENAGGTGTNPNVTIQMFTQKLDHFNGADSRTWYQKYWVNSGFWRAGGPVFLMLGGEGPTSRHWIDTDEGTPDWLKNAQTFGALCFQLEHRFYGESYPLPNMSVPNLRYLSSRQALADAASFIQGMNIKYNLPPGTKWVTFGGSYSGALSAWFRLKYPHLVVGAVASSAPVLAQLDFKQNISYKVKGIYANTVTIPAVCRLMLNPSMPNVIDRYAAVNKLILDTSGQECLDYNYAKMIDFLRQTNFTAGDASWRLWTWQTCTEFGYYQDSNSTKQPFSNHFPLSFSIKQCADIFEPEFTKTSIAENVKYTNNYYGGMNFHGTNVILPNGSIDPWHALSILRSIGPTTTAAFILGTAHCADMYPPRQADMMGLGHARQEITEAIRMWLNSE